MPYVIVRLEWRSVGETKHCGMAFTVEDFQQLTQLLDERPEWRAELRRILLADEVLDMPRVLGALESVQQRTEDCLQRMAYAWTR